jgi:hypothetical protein
VEKDIMEQTAMQWSRTTDKNALGWYAVKQNRILSTR